MREKSKNQRDLFNPCLKNLFLPGMGRFSNLQSSSNQASCSFIINPKDTRSHIYLEFTGALMAPQHTKEPVLKASSQAPSPNPTYWWDLETWVLGLQHAGFQVARLFLKERWLLIYITLTCIFQHQQSVLIFLSSCHTSEQLFSGDMSMNKK